MDIAMTFMKLHHHSTRPQSAFSFLCILRPLALVARASQRPTAHYRIGTPFPCSARRSSHALEFRSGSGFPPVYYASVHRFGLPLGLALRRNYSEHINPVVFLPFENSLFLRLSGQVLHF
jgi:hypothetical protein